MGRICSKGGNVTTWFGSMECMDRRDGHKEKLLSQWCYGGSQWDMACDIIETEDGYTIAASTNSSDGDVIGFHGNEWSIHLDIWAFKIDFYGNLIWQKCLGGSLTEYPTYITQTNDGV
jgi:hypothetical protein